MKLSELRKEVYRVAKVTTTKQLKAKYDDIKSLDMRYKSSWEQALEQLAESVEEKNSSAESRLATRESAKDSSTEHSTQNKSAFKNWLDNPPAEYKELFAEAEDAFTAIGDKLAKGKKLITNVKTMAEGLNEFAEASLEEAEQLLQAVQRKPKDSK